MSWYESFHNDSPPSSIPQTADPAFSQPFGNYVSGITVSISDGSSGAVIYVTTDGSVPTTASPVYVGPITVSSSATVQAIALAPGLQPSNIVGGQYLIGQQAASPVFSPAGGTYMTPQLVTLFSSTRNATIHYTTDGSTPTASSPVYTGPITVNASETVKAIAISPGYLPSPVISTVYQILPQAQTPVFTPVGGVFNAVQAVSIASNPGASIYFTTDGSTPTPASTLYTAPITVIASETLKAIAVEPGVLVQSAVGTASFIINLQVAQVLASVSSGTYANAFSTELTCATPGSTIYYTTDGSTPTTSSPVYSGPITVSTTETIKAIGVASGYTNSAQSTYVYFIVPLAATPTINPPAGNYSGPVTVSLACTTPGSSIYYTLDGSQPLGTSPLYSAPFVVQSSEVVQAVAIAPGFQFSGIASTSYVISSGTVLSFNPASASPIVLPTATQNVNYSDTFATLGGVAPIVFGLAAGSSLPSPMQLNPTTGQLTGATTAPAGSYSFTITATDHGGISAFPVVSSIQNDDGAGAVQEISGISFQANALLPQGALVLFFTTSATYGGQHSNRTLADTEGNSYALLQNAIGLSNAQGGSINQSQETTLWYAANIQGDSVTADTFTITYGSNGDRDYMAGHAYILKSTDHVITSVPPNIQNGTGAGDGGGIAPGPNVLSPSVTLSQSQVPCTIWVMSVNVSNLGNAAQLSTYAPTPASGSGFTLVDEFWKFTGPLTTASMSRRDVTAPGTYQLTLNNNSNVNEYFQTHLVVTSATAVNPSVASQAYTLPVAAAASQYPAQMANTFQVVVGNGQLTVSGFTAPPANGSPALTGYTAVLTQTSNGAVTKFPLYSTTITPIVCTATNGQAYTVTMHAFNNNGPGPDTSPAMGPYTPVSAVNLPSAPGPITITSQSNNGCGLAWGAAAAGAYPLANYNIYRNTVFLATSSVTSYQDTTAANTNSPTYGGGNPDPTDAIANTAYTYTVSAMDTQGNEGPQQTLLSYVGYKNGSNGFLGSYDFLGVSNFNDTTGVPQGGTADVSFTVTSPNGIWQPYFGANTTQWDMNTGAMDHLRIDLKAIAAGQDWQLQILSRLPPGDLFPFKTVNISSYVTIQQGEWVTANIPLADLNMGVTQFTGSVGGPTGTTTFTNESGTHTWNTVTLTAASNQSGPGVDVGGFITGGGLPVGCYVMAYNQASSIGTFILTGPNVTSGTTVAANTSLTCTRGSAYKLHLRDQTGLSSNKFYIDNVILSGTQPLGSGGSGSTLSIRQQIANYLASLPGKTTKNILVGQHADPFPSNPNSTSSVLAQVNAFNSSTGKYPAIVPFIINDVQNNSYAAFSTVLQCLPIIRAQGAIAAVSWYVPVPNRTGGAPDPQPSVSATQFLSMLPAGQLGSSGAWNAFFNSIIDNVGAQLQQVLAGGPAFFRPFIELNGTLANGFNWYGGQDTAVFQAVWKYVYSRLMGGPGSTYNFSQGLLWVYSVNNFQGNYIAYLPAGDSTFPSYADVVGTDTYASGSPPGQDFASLTQAQSQWSLLKSTGLPVTMWEAGPAQVSAYNGGNGPVPTNAFSNLTYLNAITGSGGVSNPITGCVAFNCWTQGCELANQNDLSTLLASPLIVTASDLPAGFATGS